MNSAGFADFVNRNDIRMIQGGGGLCFLHKPSHPVGISGKFRRQNLERNAAVEFCIGGKINFAHSASAQKFFDFIMPDFFTNETRFGFASGKHFSRQRFERRI